MQRKLMRTAFVIFLLTYPARVVMGEWWWCTHPPTGCASRYRDYYDSCWNWLGWESFDPCIDPPVHSGSKPEGAYYTREVQTYCDTQTDWGPLCSGPNGENVQCPF